jgi:CubicO group peptidase (beta-lactamase class C family)
MKILNTDVQRVPVKLGLILILPCCLFMAAAQVITQGPAASALSAFDDFYRWSLQENKIIGSSFMLIHANQVIDRQFYGMYDLENKKLVDENTIYHWASITKTFTGIAIMQLRDRGRLKLDDPIVKYIPELRQVHDPYGDINEITIQQLMSHTAGLRGATWPWGGDKDWHPFEPQKWEQIVAMLPYTEVEFKPGSKFSYSNLGVVFLGRVIELLSDDCYQVYVDKNILKPLGMYHSYFDTTPNYLLKNRAHSYRVRGGKVIPAVFDANTGITVSNGGLNAPLPDMVKFINFLMGDPKLEETYTIVLKRSSLEEMWVPRAEVTEGVEGGQNRKDAVGLSFFIEDNFGQRFIGHSGYQNAFKTHLYLNQETRTAYLIAYNTYVAPNKNDSYVDTDRLDVRIKDYLFEHVFPVLRK